MTTTTAELWIEIVKRAIGPAWSEQSRYSMNAAGSYLHQLVAMDHREPDKRVEFLMRTVLSLSTALQSSHDAYVNHLNLCPTPTIFIPAPPRETPEQP